MPYEATTYRLIGIIHNYLNNNLEDFSEVQNLMVRNDHGVIWITLTYTHRAYTAVGKWENGRIVSLRRIASMVSNVQLEA